MGQDAARTSGGAVDARSSGRDSGWMAGRAEDLPGAGRGRRGRVPRRAPRRRRISPSRDVTSGPGLEVFGADGVTAKEPVEALALDAGAAGRLGDVAVQLAHERDEVLAGGAVAGEREDLLVGEVALGAARGARAQGGADLLGERLELDTRAVGDGEGALDDVLEFAHVARPVVADERRQRLGGETLGRVGAVGVPLEEDSCEGRDVLAPLAQGRERDVEDVEAV